MLPHANIKSIIQNFMKTIFVNCLKLEVECKLAVLLCWKCLENGDIVNRVLYLPVQQCEFYNIPPCFSYHQARSQGGRGVGCDAPPKKNLPKGPHSATKWPKNWVFVGGLRGWSPKSPLLVSKRSTFWEFRTSPQSNLATGLLTIIPLAYPVNQKVYSHKALRNYIRIRKNDRA